MSTAHKIMILSLLHPSIPLWTSCRILDGLGHIAIDPIDPRGASILDPMITPICSKCLEPIPAGEINVPRDVAFCRSCTLTFTLSELNAPHPTAANLADPPEGAWYRDSGAELVAGATCRSLGTAFGLLIFCLFWNGIVSAFVLLALASTIQHLGGTLPAWFPAPKLTGGGMGPGMTIFLWLFLTPFMMVGLALLLGLVMSLAGRTEVRVRESGGEVFSGIGPIGLCHRFDPASVRSIRLEDRQVSSTDGVVSRQASIVLETDEATLKFGTLLTYPRRTFLASALREALAA